MTLAPGQPAQTPQQPDHTISGWGRIPRPGREVAAHDLEAASRDAVLFRGLGRSYGDSAIPPPSQPVVVTTPLADRIRSFDRATGQLRAEAGLSVMALNDLFLREGWFVPVTPGTAFVTLGGMIAADVHGKNHHVDGTFGEHVELIRLRVADGRIIEATPEHESELFWATMGGMGLTGHILEVQFRMRKIPTPWITRETRRITGIANFIGALKGAAGKWPFTMGWVDCLSRGASMGRGILISGRWAEPHEAPRKAPGRRHTFPIPMVFPQWALNPLFVRMFNMMIYHKHIPAVRHDIIHPEKFFYPLDLLNNWNRIYGPKGFTQYQCVIPEDGSGDLTRQFFDLLTQLGGASFLCVIKDCGPQGHGMLSFPMQGISVALDIPVRPHTQAMIDALNDFIVKVGGRIYLCKDMLTRAEHFHAMEPRLAAWQAVRHKWDPAGKIRSAQSVRLFGDAP